MVCKTEITMVPHAEYAFKSKKTNSTSRLRIMVFLYFLPYEKFLQINFHETSLR